MFKNELHIFSISKAWNELHKPRKKRKTSPKPLAPMWWRNEQELSSPEPRIARTSELNGSSGGRGKGIRGPRSFVPVGDTNRDKRGAFYPGWWLQSGQKGCSFVPVGATNLDKKPPFCLGWCLQPGQNSLAPLFSSLSLRPSHSAHLFLLFLARERRVLAHFLDI